jgi:hypothetical protein
MTRGGLKSVVFGAVVAAALVVPVTAAQADRWDRGGRDRHEWHDRDQDRGHDHGGGRVDIDIHGRPGPFERPPVIVDRPQQVWVEPVYRTVCDRVWVEPVYQTTCEKVWREPVVQKRVERTWVPEQRVVQDVRRGNRVSREWVFVPGHYEDHSCDVVVSPGHWEDVQKQVLVSAGHWEDVQRQELVCAGHWETHVERVAVAPPVHEHDGVRVNVRLPLPW